MEEAKGKSKQFNRAKRKCSQEYVVCNREGSINEQKWKDKKVTLVKDTKKNPFELFSSSFVWHILFKSPSCSYFI
jgi:hypothetical protein